MAKKESPGMYASEFFARALNQKKLPSIYPAGTSSNRPGSPLFPAFLLSIVVFLVGMFFIYSFTTEVKEPSILVNPVNSKIYSVLVEAHFAEAVVDNTPERTLIGIPVNSEQDGVATAYFAMGAATIISPETPKIIVQLYEDTNLSIEIEAKTSDVIAFAKQEINENEFNERLIKSKASAGFEEKTFKLKKDLTILSRN